jgi:hypothetical protein
MRAFARYAGIRLQMPLAVAIYCAGLVAFCKTTACSLRRKLGSLFACARCLTNFEIFLDAPFASRRSTTGTLIRGLRGLCEAGRSPERLGTVSS